jgi:cell division septation protein DedD
MTMSFGTRESRALLVFFGGALVLFAFFAIGTYIGRHARPSATDRPAPTEARGAAEYYLVEVAVVDKQSDADALLAKLRQQYISAYSAQDPSNPGLYSVYVGPYPHRDQADTVRAELADQGLQPKIVKQR